MQSHLLIFFFLFLEAVTSDDESYLDIFSEGGYVDDNGNLFSSLEEMPIIDNNMGEDLNPDLLASNEYCSSTSSLLFDDSAFQPLTRKIRIRQRESCSSLQQQKEPPPIKLELPQLQLPSESESQNPLLRVLPIKPPFYKEPVCKEGKIAFCCPYPAELDGSRRNCIFCEYISRQQAYRCCTSSLFTSRFEIIIWISLNIANQETSSSCVLDLPTIHPIECSQIFVYCCDIKVSQWPIVISLHLES